MPVLKTFVSHTGPDYEEHIRPLLRQVAPLGVRPWIDKDDLAAAGGHSLSQALQAAIFSSCQSMLLLLSARSVERNWVRQEVDWGTQRWPAGIIPIALEDPEKLTLPDEIRRALRMEDGKVRTIYLRPESPRFAEALAASVLRASGFDACEDLVLHLGHRREQAEAEVPAAWSRLPALDLRTVRLGHRDYSPAPEEWLELDEKMALLRRLLPRLRRLRVCGQAPLGVAALVGKHWDRRSGVDLIEGYNRVGTIEQVWSSALSLDEQRRLWTPETAKVVKMERPALAFRRDRLVVAMLPAERPHYLDEARAFCRSLDPEPTLCWIQTPLHIGSPAEAQALLGECVGALQHLRHRFSGTLDLITALPLGIQPLLTHHLRQLGPLHFFDQVQPDRCYRQAFTVS